MSNFWRFFRADSSRRIIALLVLALGAAFMMSPQDESPELDLAVGEIAQFDIRAPKTFHYVDQEKRQTKVKVATDKVPLVFDFDANLNIQLQDKLRNAFTRARAQLSQADDAIKVSTEFESPLKVELPKETLSQINTAFQNELGAVLPPADLTLLHRLNWSPELESLSIKLLDEAMKNPIISDKAVIPKGGQSMTVIQIYESDRSESSIDDMSKIKTPEETRKNLSYSVIQWDASKTLRQSAISIVKALVQVNFRYNHLLTEDRREVQRNLIADDWIVVKKGTVILREGDPVSAESMRKLDHISAMQEQGYGPLGIMLIAFSFVCLIAMTLYFFAVGYVRKFSIKPRDIETLSFLTLLMLGFGRWIIDGSEAISHYIGAGMSPNALWYLTPFACGAMLVRILINSETALIWIIGTSLMMGLMMDQQALFTAYFVISGVVASSGLAHTKERVHLLRAGLQAGMVNAAAALLIRLAQMVLVESPIMNTMHQPLWDVGFAVLGGVLSAFLTLALLPVFELVGFVTDYKMLELANLNHPLLRQLMLRAPGTYSHSMTMALLSEAAAESIGANALQVRIACYYHDIGKSLQPQYFIENQRGEINPHDRLQAHQSARIIMTHVVDGAALGERYNLPQPVMDAIWMHHGTSLIKYFYVKAVESAEPGESVDEMEYRYPGKIPNTREAGIIFLADRVEAACRTLKDPTINDFRKMTEQLVNSAIAEGQLEDCPLTLKEIYTVIEVFTETLMSIHHHRIEYPKMPAKKQSPPPNSAVITLESSNPHGIEAD